MHRNSNLLRRTLKNLVQLLGTGIHIEHEELNAMGFPAEFLDMGNVVQPMYYYTRLTHNMMALSSNGGVPYTKQRDIKEGNYFK
jgi:hypothetical protein